MTVTVCLITEHSSCTGTVKDIFNDISIIKALTKEWRGEMNHSKIVIPLTKCNESECAPCRLPFSSKSYCGERKESLDVFISAGVMEQEFRGRTRRLFFVYLVIELQSLILFLHSLARTLVTSQMQAKKQKRTIRGSFIWLNVLFRKSVTSRALCSLSHYLG